MYTVEVSPCATKLIVMENGEAKFLVEWDGPSYITDIIKTNVEAMVTHANNGLADTVWAQVTAGYKPMVDNLRDYLNQNNIPCNLVATSPENIVWSLQVSWADYTAAVLLVEQWFIEEE